MKALLILLLLDISTPVFAQQDMTAEWKLSVADLERRLASAEDSWRTDAESLRAALVAYAEAHPEFSLHVPSVLPEKLSPEAQRQRWEQLNAAVNEAISKTSPFNLGRIVATFTETLLAPSPVANSIDQTELRNLNLTNAAKALDYLPGVSIQHIATNRNEAGMMVRGFSTRGQAPLYLDGVPISVPYDGYVNFNRFLASRVSAANTAINILPVAPKNKIVWIARPELLPQCWISRGWT